MAKNRVKLSLKLLNSAMGLGGIATIVYGVLMFRVWQTERQGSFSHHIATPWYFHAFLVVGIALCAITCLGHIAADTANICWLSTYINILLLLLILETVIMADAFVNPSWKKELSANLSDKFDDFMDFAASYDYIWKWVAWMNFLLQAICALLATLRIHETTEADSQDSEDEDPEPILPLLGTSGRWRPPLGTLVRWEQSDPNIV